MILFSWQSDSGHTKVDRSFIIFQLQCDCHEMRDFVLLKRVNSAIY